MRNIKRALSLLMTMAMLISMLVIPGTAASTFTDESMIVNKEAVQITSGIGLFAGADGKFNPKGLVTRAQMATIIVKMLRGSDFNADAFKGVGVNPFSDTADFEGGWAEGYINACSQLGVVAGYGDGTFKPGNTLTTAEAMTMIINALGVDPGQGQWPINYMAKAEALKLYGDLAVKPTTDAPLNRDQLAVIVWEGLQYSPEGKSGYKIPGSDLIFTDIADAVLANGNSFEGITEAVGQDSLASKIYEVKTATGWITGNAATGEDCTVLTLADGSDEYYNAETGVDMLGHYATVYYKEQYKNDEDPGLVYTIVDESTVVTVKEAIDTAKEYKAAFGKSINVAQNGLLLGSDYTVTEKLGDDLDEAVALLGYTAGSAAPKGTYVITDGAIVAYIEPAAVYASFVTDISTTEGKESVWLNGANGDAAIPNTEGDDQIIEYAGMSVGDYVTYTVVNGVFSVSPVKSVSGKVTKTATAEINGETYETITIDGKDYPAFEPKDTLSSNNYASYKLDSKQSGIQYGENYTLYVTEDGHYIGFESSGGSVSVDDTVYILGSITTKSTDSYGKWVMENKARGVDMDGKEVLVLLGKQAIVSKDDTTPNGDLYGTMDSVTKGFYTVEESTDKDEKKEGIQVMTPFNSSYSVDNPSFITTLYNRDSSSTFSGAGAVITQDGLPTYFNDESRFIFVDGDVTDSNPITASVELGRMTPRAQNQAYPMLVTRDPGGSINMCNVLIIQEAADGVKSYVYVSAEQLASSGMTADGKEYQVYDATSGSEKTVVIDDSSRIRFTNPGFYTLATDSDGVVTVYAAAPEKDVTTKSWLFRTNYGFKGVTNKILRGSRSDGALGYTNTQANNMTVVDVRTEEEIEASGVPEITSAAQLTSLRENNPALALVYDLTSSIPESGSNYPAKVMFVKRAERKSPGIDNVVYTAGSIAGDGDDDARMVFVSGTGKAVGEAVTVAYDAANHTAPGYYRYVTNMDDGKLILQSLTPDVNSRGFINVIGLHNRVTAISGNTITTTDFTDQCGVTCTGSNEAVKEFTVYDETVFLDENGARITFEQLKALYNANRDEFVVNYYCAASAAKGGVDVDTTAEIVTVYTPVFISHVTEGTALTADTSALTDGIYYLSDDLAATGAITVSGNVTLCLNGCTLSAPATGAGESFINVAAGANLIICGGKDCRAARSNGTISGTGTTNTRGINVAGTLTLSDATIDGFTTTKDGGGVCVVEGGNFIMNAGTISNNTAANGGGIVNGSGKLTINGGSIVLNTATGSYGGGIYAYKSGTAQHTTYYGACLVAGNQAVAGSGGGIANRNSPATYNGTIIGGTKVTDASELTATSGNIAKNGGGLYTAGKQTDLALTDLTITGNYASSNGGGFSTGSGQAFVNLTLTNNTAGGIGGGAYVTYGTSFENPVITGNTANEGGGMYFITSSTTYKEFKVTGGTISNNTAATNGGGIYAKCNNKAEQVLSLSGVTITGNTAGTLGGGLYVTHSKITWATIDIDSASITGNTATEDAATNDTRLPA